MFIDAATVINSLLIIGLILLIYIAIELIRIVIAARKLINRVECLTDLGGWFNFFKRSKRQKT